MTHEWRELLAELRAEVRRRVPPPQDPPVPPPQDPPDVGRRRLAEAAAELFPNYGVDAHITDDPDDPEGHPR